MSGPLPMTLPERRQILAWGVMWGVLVAAAEGAVIQDPDAGLRDSLQFWLLQWLLPLWCAVGCLHLVVARRAERQGGWKVLLAGWLGVTASWVVLQPLLRSACDSLLGIDSRRESRVEVMLFDLWPCLFYGGLLVMAAVLAIRTERARSLLQDAAIARSRTTTLRGQLELAALQGQVDPAMLLEVMGEVEQRYRQAPDQAAEMLGRLVEFLRCAMPGLKERTSTLAAELQLARASADLQHSRMAGNGGLAGHAGAAPRHAGLANWTLCIPAVLPSLAFPGQFMLPLMALAAPNAEPVLRVWWQGSAVCIEARELGRDVPDGFAQQARLSLRSVLGDRFSLQIDTAHPPAFALTLTLTPLQSPGATDAS